MVQDHWRRHACWMICYWNTCLMLIWLWPPDLPNQISWEWNGSVWCFSCLNTLCSNNSTIHTSQRVTGSQVFTLNLWGLLHCQNLFAAISCFANSLCTDYWRCIKNKRNLKSKLMKNWWSLHVWGWMGVWSAVPSVLCLITSESRVAADLCSPHEIHTKWNINAC